MPVIDSALDLLLMVCENVFPIGENCFDFLHLPIALILDGIININNTAIGLITSVKLIFMII